MSGGHGVLWRAEFDGGFVCVVVLRTGDFEGFNAVCVDVFDVLSYNDKYVSTKTHCNTVLFISSIKIAVDSVVQW